MVAISKTHYNFEELIYTFALDTLWMVLFQGLHTSILPTLSHPKSIDRVKSKRQNIYTER